MKNNSKSYSSPKHKNSIYWMRWLPSISATTPIECSMFVRRNAFRKSCSSIVYCLPNPLDNCRVDTPNAQDHRILRKPIFETLKINSCTSENNNLFEIYKSFSDRRLWSGLRSLLRLLLALWTRIENRWCFDVRLARITESIRRRSCMLVSFTKIQHNG